MLQTITPHHDAHHMRSESTSLASLTASLSDGRKHVLLAASGSVATIKLPQIIQALADRHGRQQEPAPPSTSGSDAVAASGGLSIRVVLTQSAARFLAGQSVEQPTLSAIADLPCVDAIYGDADEWGPRPWRRGGGILHIELRRWADVLVIAPLSANTLAKIANGMCDNLLTSVVRAWDTDGAVDGRRKRIIACPAMNTAMWRHPITARQVRTLEKEWGVLPPPTATRSGDHGNGASAAAAAPPHSNAGSESLSQTVDAADGGAGGRGEGSPGGWFVVMPPQEKILACGDVGQGGMADWTEVVKVIESTLALEA